MANDILVHAMLAAAVLDGVYWVCLCAGGGLLLLSVFGGEFGDSEADAGVDIDADVDFGADMGGDIDLGGDVGDASGGVEGAGLAEGALALTTWFSMRFVVFFSAVFGAVGLILTHLSGVEKWPALAVALAAGLVVGQGVHQLFLAIRRTSGNSATRPQDYVNKLARVTIGIADSRKGEVSMQVRNARRFVPAVAAGAVQEFKIGDEVVVIGYRAGVARVVSREEHERGT